MVLQKSNFKFYFKNKKDCKGIFFVKVVGFVKKELLSDLFEFCKNRSFYFFIKNEFFFKKNISKIKENISSRFKFGDQYFLGKERLLKILMSFYGLGYYSVLKICKVYGLGENILLYQINKKSPFLLETIYNFIFKNFLVGRLLIRQRVELMENKESLGLLHGIRFFQGLPVRGQRTHCNASTPKKQLGVFLQLSKDVKGKR